MFCEHCGTKIEEGSQFCQNCGREVYSATNNIAPLGVSSPVVLDTEIFYSKEWRRKNVFALSALPPFDVMVDGRYLYLIKLPKYSGSTIGFILGLLIGNIIGAYIGSSIGESGDTKNEYGTDQHGLIRMTSSSHKPTSMTYLQKFR